MDTDIPCKFDGEEDTRFLRCMLVTVNMLNDGLDRRNKNSSTKNDLL